MTDPLNLFISHSSKDNELTKKLSSALRAATDLKCDSIVDFEVIPQVDYDALIAGKHWPRQLHEWMARCHAGVLLLTANSVKSDWVLKEATILAWRLSLDPQFHLFTLVTSDVTSDLLTANKFDPLALGQVEQIRTDDMAEAAKKIQATLKANPPPASTPFDRLVGRLGDLLNKIGQATLASVAERARVKKGPWRPDRDAVRQYVEAIAAGVLNESLGAYEGIHELMDDLSSTTDVETMAKILALVSPYWVDVEAAGKLPALTKRQPRRAAGMNGSFVGAYTAEMYVSRAHPLSNLFRVIETVGRPAGDPAIHYEKEICQRLRKLWNSEDSDDEIVKALANRKPSYYVVIGQMLHADSLAKLHGRFPKITFIVWPGESLPQSASSDIDWLEPPVDVGRESIEHDNWSSAKDILRNVSQR